MGPLADHQIAIVGQKPAPAQLRQLFQKRLRVDHHAVAQHAPLAAPAQHARRDQVRDDLTPPDDQRVTRICAATESDHHIGELRIQVDDLAFSLVAPLRADDDYVCHPNTILPSSFGRVRPATCKRFIFSGAIYAHRGRTIKGRTARRLGYIPPLFA